MIELEGLKIEEKCPDSNLHWKLFGPYTSEEVALTKAENLNSSGWRFVRIYHLNPCATSVSAQSQTITIKETQ